jgi:DNA-binding NarL/FixJ family response regulator
VGSRRVSVVVLYAHPLLGEGIDRLLSAERDLDVVCIPMTAVDLAERALAACPDVVVVERSDPVAAMDILKYAPDALFIDVGLDSDAAWTIRRQEIPSRVDGIVNAIRGARRRSSRSKREPVAVVEGTPAEAPAVGGA